MGRSRGRLHFTWVLPKAAVPMQVWVLQHSPYSCPVPNRLSGLGEEPSFIQSPTDFPNRCPFFTYPVKYLLNHSCLFYNQFHCELDLHQTPC